MFVDRGFGYTPAGQIAWHSGINPLYEANPAVQSQSYKPDGLTRYATVAGCGNPNDLNSNP